MTYYALLFIAGFAGSFHCIGMCGGFACALGADPRGASATSVRHLLYNAGRLTTYSFLGGLAGGLGLVICTSLGSRSAPEAPILHISLDAAQRALAVLAGLLMILMALRFLRTAGLATRQQRLRWLDVGHLIAHPAAQARARRAARLRCAQWLSTVSAGLRDDRAGRDNR